MAHLSDWHKFDPSDRNTYPREASRVQVRFTNGEIEEGESGMYFPRITLLPSSTITAWRYVKTILN